MNRDDPLAPVISRTMLLLSNALRAARANDHAPVLENLCELHELFGEIGQQHTRDREYIEKVEQKESERTTQLIEARQQIERLTREREHVRAMLYSLLGETSQVCRIANSPLADDAGDETRVLALTATPNESRASAGVE